MIEYLKFLFTRKSKRLYQCQESWDGIQWGNVFVPTKRHNAEYLAFFKKNKYGIQTRVIRIK